MTAQDSLTEALSVSIIASQLENLPESAPARRDIWSVIIDKVTSDAQSLQVSLHGTVISSWLMEVREFRRLAHGPCPGCSPG